MKARRQIGGLAFFLLFAVAGCTSGGSGEAGDEASDALSNSVPAEVSQVSRDTCELVLSLGIWEEASIPPADALDSFRERHEYSTRLDLINDGELSSLFVISSLEAMVSNEINSDNPLEVELMGSLAGLSEAATEATDIIWDFAKSPNFYFDGGAAGDEAASVAADELRNELRAAYEATVQELYVLLPAPLGACIVLEL